MNQELLLATLATLPLVSLRTSLRAKLGAPRGVILRWWYQSGPLGPKPLYYNGLSLRNPTWRMIRIRLTRGLARGRPTAACELGRFWFRLDFGEVGGGGQAGKAPNPGDVVLSLGYADGAAGLEQVEEVGALDDMVVARIDQPELE